MRLIDLTGKTFGRLTVLKRDASGEGKRVRWICLCSCGTEKSISSNNLLTGDTNSCGCLATEKTIAHFTTHGMSKSPEYGVWHSMIMRCHNPNAAKYKDYGGRGITVCDRWKASFELFIEDMGRRPSKNHSIERINNSEGYKPDNCKWATATEQSSNKRNNLKGMFLGTELTLSDLARNTGISINILRKRIVRDGLSFEEAVSLGDGIRRYQKDGYNLSLKEWSEKLNIPYKILHNRIRIRKWPIEKALDNTYWE